MTSVLCSEARTRSTLSPAFQLGNGLRRHSVWFFSAGVGDLGGGAPRGDLVLFFENNGHGSWFFYTGSNFVFGFLKKHSICAKPVFQPASFFHVQGLHLFVLDNFRRRDQCKSCTRSWEKSDVRIRYIELYLKKKTAGSLRFAKLVDLRIGKHGE